MSFDLIMMLGSSRRQASHSPFWELMKSAVLDVAMHHGLLVHELEGLSKHPFQVIKTLKTSAHCRKMPRHQSSQVSSRSDD